MSAATEKARLILSLRRSGVTDADVLSAIETLPRELFVPPALAGQAWDDRALRRDVGHFVAEADALWAMVKYTVSEAGKTGVELSGTGW